jgi:hypothetical protein
VGRRGSLKRKFEIKLGVEWWQKQVLFCIKPSIITPFHIASHEGGERACVSHFISLRLSSSFSEMADMG